MKKIGVTREFQPRAKQIFFYFISPPGETIFAKICNIFYKNVIQKKHVSYAVTGLYTNHTHVKKVGTSQNFFLVFIGELENHIIIKKTVEVGQ